MPQAIPFIASAVAKYVGASMLVQTLVVVASSLAVADYQRSKLNRQRSAADAAAVRARTVTVRSGVAPRKLALGTVRMSGPLMYAEFVGDDEEYFDSIVALTHGELSELVAIYLDDERLDVSAIVSQAPTTGKYAPSSAKAERIEHIATLTAASTITLAHVPSDTVDVRAVLVTGVGESQENTALTVSGVVGAVVTLSAPVTGDVHVSYSTLDTVQAPIKLQWAMGSASQASTSWSGVSTPKWTVDHRLRGVSYLRALMRMEDNVFATGTPNLSAVVRGPKGVYDPRTLTTINYTSNPALLAAWYRTLPRADGGLGVPTTWIDWAGVATAANICDELITVRKLDGSGYETVKRYECHTVLSLDQPPLQNLQTILDAMAGDFPFTAGQYRCFAGAFRSATLTITDVDVAGGASIVLAPMVGGDQSSANSVTGTFFDAAHGWIETGARAVTNATYVTADGAEQSVPLDLDATTDERQANYLMGVHLERQRPALAGSLTLAGVGANVALMDTVQFNLDGYSAIAGKTFEVRRRTNEFNGRYPIEFREIKSTTYALDADRFTPAAPVTPPDNSALFNVAPVSIASVVATVLRQSDGTRINRALVTWAAHTQSFVLQAGTIELRYRQPGGEWIFVPPVPGSHTAAYIGPLADASVIFIEARARNGLGAVSEWTGTAPYTVTGDTTPPSNVTGLAYAIKPSQVVVTWTMCPDLDYAATELREGASWAAGALIAVVSGREYQHPRPSNGTYSVWVAHVDASGNYSAAPASLSVTVDDSIDPAAAANAAIADMASDSKFTPVEKQAIRKDWQAIFADATGIDASAVALGITTERTTWLNALQALGDYLNNGTSYTYGATPPLWITDAQLSVTTTIVGSTFRSTWATYYGTRQALLDKIAAVAATKANYANLTGTPSSAIANSAITLSSSGVLSGAGGGAVTIGGLGYVGALDATKNTNRSGSGVPSAGLGIDGDSYYDTAAKFLYSKAGGAWTRVGAGQITTSNVSTFFDSAAIGSAQIGTLAAANIGADTINATHLVVADRSNLVADAEMRDLVAWGSASGCSLVATSASDAVFVGSISGTTLTVASTSVGAAAVGQVLVGAGVALGTRITAGTGPTYTVSHSQTVAAGTSMTGTAATAVFTGSISGTTLTVSSVASGSIGVWATICGTNVSAGTYITGQTSGSAGGAGDYTVSVSQTTVSTTISATQTFASANYMRITGSSGSYAGFATTRPIPVVAGVEYAIRAQSRRVAGGGAGGWMYCHWTTDEVGATFFDDGHTQIAAGATLETKTIMRRAPAGMRFLRITIYKNNDTTTQVDIGGVVVRRAMSAELIVDGAIRANHMFVTSLAAITANLGTVDIASGGYLKSGKTSFTDTTNAGFILGNNAGVHTFFIGNAGNTKSMTWDGTDLTFRIGAAAGIKFYDVNYSRAMGSIEGFNYGSGNAITLASPAGSGGIALGGAALASSNGAGQSYAVLLANSLGSNAATLDLSPPAASGAFNLVSKRASSIVIGADAGSNNADVLITTGGANTQSLTLDSGPAELVLDGGNGAGASITSNCLLVAPEVFLTDDAPGMWFYENDVGTNLKVWMMVVDGSTMQIQTRTDALAYTASPFQLDRSGNLTLLGAATLGAPLKLPTHAGRPANRAVGQVAMIYTTGGTTDARTGTPRPMYADGTDWRLMNDNSIFAG